MREYDIISDWYATERGANTVGVPEALAVAATLTRGARILDVGCGNGVPITRALVAGGHQVVGLDTSGAMLARFLVNVPHSPAVRGNASACPFAPASFDAAVSWGMMFHLTPDDQSDVLASIGRVLKPGAPFLFTGAEIETVSGDDPGISGTMNGVTFHYWAVASYRSLVARHGFELVNVHDDPGVSTYYLTRKTA